MLGRQIARLATSLLVMLLFLSGCSSLGTPTQAGDHSPEGNPSRSETTERANLAEFFTTSFPKSASIGTVSSIVEAANASAGVATGSVVDVRVRESTLKGSTLFLIVYVVEVSVIRGGVEGNAQGQVEVLADVSEKDPSDVVAKMRKIQPNFDLLWFLTSFDAMAEERRKSLAKRDETPTQESITEFERYAGLYASGPFGIIAESDGRLVMPAIGTESEYSTLDLVKDLDSYESMAQLIEAVTKA